MRFKATFKKEDGSEETRVVEAENRFSVYQEAEKTGETVTAIEEAGRGWNFKALASLTIGKGIKVEEHITFVKNLAAMLSAGLNLNRALSVIERQTSNKVLKRIVTELQTAVKGGMSFHEALAQHPKIFSKLEIAMSKAGEESGTLAESLRVVAKQMDRAHTLMKKVKGAMIYPGIILFAIIVIGILMMVYVVPTLASTFTELGVELPTSTKIILAVSDFMVNNIVLVIASVLLLMGLIVYALRSPAGAAVALRGSLYIPVVSTIVKETFSARAARTLSSLLSSGVEMLTAISITREVVGNRIFGKPIEEAEELVRKGEPLSASFAKYPKLYPVLFTDMIAVGEETGKVADMLGQVAEYYETDVEDKTKDLSTVIEPVLMLIIGAAVGVFAFSMIGPIYSLTSQIG
ncbi:MAG: type II secretion system F family protein [Candidatus Pacebacteria bacterium]|nr:type II secretion system F family protein [Candidatus Paceibacterota bacterium]MBP9840136.1 type II secretion system F family protein [Candidatus Paceibacterota bacterium]